MRTTLTLDDDVAAKIEGLRKARKQSLKDLVNDALREGLKQLAAPKGRRAPFRTEEVDLGRCLLGNVDNVAEVLAVAEGDSFR
jgi:Ribbon-helix-helix protein, copG family